MKGFGAALFIAATAGCLLSPLPVAAQAQQHGEIDIPAGRLSSAIRLLSRQTGTSIATNDSGLRQVRSRRLRGSMSVGEALRRLLDGTPYRAVAIRGGAYRIERRPMPSAARSGPVAPIIAGAPLSPPPPPPRPIIVEATKRSAAPTDYAGGIRVLDLNTPGLLPSGASLEELLASVPAVNGTALGSGRNKIFLRGIADSSFNGPTQSTIGLYLGEQRLIFSAPNPDLRLVDVEAVELLEGPQGSLYGAGTLAGLLRVNPRAPDPSAFGAEGWVGGAITDGGEESWDIGGVLNVPVSEGSALRIVGYGGEDGGYIDNDVRGDLTNINASEYLGGRAAYAADLGADWSVELSAFGQEIRQQDGQYINGELPGLTRSDQLAQAFLGRIYGGALTVRGYLGDSEIVSTTGMVDNHLRTNFDSSILTGGASRQMFRETRNIRLMTHETRLSGGDPESFDWLIGIGALRDRDDVSQLITNLGIAENPPPFARQRFTLEEIALFGEASYRLAPEWSVTGGARLLYTSSTGERSFGADTVVEPRDGPARVLPTFALSWRPASESIVFARFQKGFRTGGVTIERAPNGDPDTARFDPDRIRSYELGLRGSIESLNVNLNGAAARLTYSAAFYHSNWRDIQADLIDLLGFPITRNIGDGTISGVDASLGLTASSGWRFDLAASYNATSADRSGPNGAMISTSIPNVPDIAVTGRIAREWDWGRNLSGGASFSGRYTGRSFLDLDGQVRAAQGDFGSVDAAAWTRSGAFELRLEALNLTNTRGNRFAFGNPFTARFQDHETPLRPFTLRAQISFRH